MKPFIHWRFCEHPEIKVVYKNPFVTMGICRDCKTRHIQVHWELPLGLNWVLERFVMWLAGKVFKDNVRWWEAKEF